VVQLSPVSVGQRAATGTLIGGAMLSELGGNVVMPGLTAWIVPASAMRWFVRRSAAATDFGAR
jgi:hypothetical protein